MNLLITGITTQSSIAYAIAEEAMNQGHDVILTNPPGRAFSICERIAKRLPKEPVAVLPMDVTDPGLILPVTAGQAAVPAVYFWYSPRMSMAFSRISTFRTLPESVMGYSSTMCT